MRWLVALSALLVLFFVSCEGASWGARRDLISTFELLMEAEYEQFDALLTTSMAPIQISWRKKYGFSLVARSDIQAGTHVLDIPKKTAIHRSTVYDTVPLISMLLKDQKDVSEASVLAVFFAHMSKKINIKKPKTLLAAHMGLMFYGTKHEPLPKMTEKEDGCGWWEVEGEAEVAKLLDDEWATVERFVTASALKVDEDGFKRALRVVLNRGFTFNIEGDDNLALIPFIDLLNHQPGAKATIKRFPPELGDYFELTLTRDYKKGEQIFIDYGPFANRKLLAEYDFAIENNPHDVLVFESASLSRKTHSEFANDILDEFTGKDRRIIIARGDEISNRTLSALRLACGFQGFYSSDTIEHNPDSCEDGSELKFLSLLSLGLPTTESHLLFREKIEQIAQKHELSLPSLLRPFRASSTSPSSTSPSELGDIYIPILSAENEICVTRQLFHSAATAYYKDQGNCADFIFRNHGEDKLQELQAIRDSLAPLQQGQQKQTKQEEEGEEGEEGGKVEIRIPKEVQRLGERELYLKFLMLIGNKLKILTIADEEGGIEEKGEEKGEE